MLGRGRLLASVRVDAGGRGEGRVKRGGGGAVT